MSNRKQLWDSPVNFISMLLIFFLIARCDVMNIHIHVPYITTLANMYGRFTALWSGLSQQIEPRYCFYGQKIVKRKGNVHCTTFGQKSFCLSIFTRTPYQARKMCIQTAFRQTAIQPPRCVYRHLKGPSVNPSVGDFCSMFRFGELV